MKKHSLKLIATGVIFSVGITSFSMFMPNLPSLVSAGAASAIEEKPLAGITISLERYCESVVESRAEAAREAEEQAQEVALVEAGSLAETTSVESTAAPEGQAEQTEAQTESEEEIHLDIKYDKLGLASVHNYLNVRKKPSEDSKIIGKMTNHNACNIISEKNGWSKIQSGNVKGYVMSKYLIAGEKAEKLAVKVARLRATVNTQTLNVRYLPSTDAHIYDQFSEDEEYTVEKENLTKKFMQQYVKKHCSKRDVKDVDLDAMYEDVENWAMLSVDDEKVFVSKDFITMKYTLKRAVTVKEEEKKQSTGTSSSSSGSGRSGIVSYAMQFLGNPYVWGGTSLTNGCDCSGFTQGIYRHFGVYLPRTSAAQAAALPSVSSSNVQVGDLFFYGSGGVSHVAMYIGNGQIIHASNHRDGIKISNAYYRKPLKIGRPG